MAGLSSNAAAIHLGRMLPSASCNPPGRLTRKLIAGLIARHAVPIRFCSRWGLPCRPCYQLRGGLLPHPFTLTPSFLASDTSRIRRNERRGGFLSVALSLGSPPPDVIRHRVSMEPGLSSHAAFRRMTCAAARPAGDAYKCVSEEKRK
jgi:hypothetical protein